jgi:starvation-inducible DNA-binding protein
VLKEAEPLARFRAALPRQSPTSRREADQIYATTDPIAERVRKLGGTTLRSIGHIGRLQRVLDNDAVFVSPLDMLAELREENARLVDRMRETHGACENHRDVATASLLEVRIDEAERRAWFLFETTRAGEERELSEQAMPVLDRTGAV